ncbi:MAG: hypothetical protein IIC51_11300, partial [Planctomycetes bacterium]|nr:hypothetical protein [Planctomycetota bacterium]
MWILGSGLSASRSDSSGGVGLGAGVRPYDSPVVVPIDPLSGVSVTIGETGIARVEGELRHTSGLIMTSHGTSISLSPLTIAPLSPTSFQEFRAAGTDKLSAATLIFPKVNVQLHRERRQLVITCDFVMLSPEAARALGDPGLSDAPIGFVIILADVELTAGSEPLGNEGFSTGSAGNVTAAAAGGVGPDIILAEMQNMGNFGTMQVCRDSGELCATDADCNACSGSGGPCLSNSDCKTCSPREVA